MYSLDIKPEADAIFHKLAKKNPKQLMTIRKKIDEIRENPHHRHKFLRKPLQTYNRVHIDNHFVMIFKINHDNAVVDVCFYGHHDDVYRWRPNPE